MRVIAGLTEIYAVGYYLVKYYLQKTDISIEETTILPHEEILKEAAKFLLGITNLFIGIVFYAWHGTELIQRKAVKKTMTI